MALLDINNQYVNDYPDDWRMKINSVPIGGIANHDLSFACYCGLGAESALSNISYLDCERAYLTRANDSDVTIEPDFTTSYNVSDFTISICRTSTNMRNTYEGQSNAFIGNLEGEAKLINVYPSFQRTSPTPIKDTLQSNGLYEGYGLNWTPISRFMFRDVILAIYVRATGNLDNNSTTFTLEEYINNRTQSYPYITEVIARPYINLPTTYVNDANIYENWNKNWLGFPSTGVPFSDIYGSTGTQGGAFIGLNHLNPTGLEYNSINWSMNFMELSSANNGDSPIIILGSLMNRNGNNTTVYLTGAGDTVQEGQAYLPFALTSKWKLKVKNVVNQHRITYRAYREYDEDFEEEAMSQCACFGMFFMRKPPSSTQDLKSSDVYMGILRNGIGHGEYTNRLEDKKNSFQWDGRSDGTGYSTGGGGGSGPDLDGDIKTPWNKNFNFNDNFHNIYVISENDVRNMSNDLVEWTATLQPTDITDIFKTVTDFSYKEFLTNNPLECVVSLKKFPFEIPHSGSQSAVRLGNYTTAASGYSPNNLVYVWEQQIFFPVRDQNKGACFLDYEPYTTAEILIPYAGTVQIPPSKFINHYINVKYVCDLQTGQMTVYISSDDTLFTSVKSNVAFEIAVTGLDKATLDAQYNNANVSAGQQALSIGSDILGIGKSSVGVLGQIARGNVQNAIGETVSTFGDIAQTALNAQSAAYDIEHIRTPFSQVGNASPICSGYGVQTAVLYVFRPVVTANLEAFRQNHGFACCDVGSINSLGLTGYTQFASVDLSGFNATAEEKNIINGIMQGGFYV